MRKCIGEKNIFALEYEFFDKDGTELSMFVQGVNILAFRRNGEMLTTRWDLEDIAFWLRSFIDNNDEAPYPVDVAGEYAAMKDLNAREFDTDDDAAFEEYYEKLYEWGIRHQWHHVSNGAVLANVFFQMTGDGVEISWNNERIDNDVEFVTLKGGAKIDKAVFCNVIDAFLKDYAEYWYKI